ncbi:molybdopterin oxidoreductase family protein [Microbispora bryophytorum]|uniref:Molybdopterin oxidoreductase family protein n=1 Tax=Microbispora bryophytorum subsp. camponoti TaxID=1677852 RepID=A0ABR8L3B5_9ACTN|nr:molybdopterin oxidoreductase family protein [Microbispora camponoti]MBD3145445.1 molybdopterin oxidoreductase family protein [Microbispora camponoti]
MPISPHAPGPVISQPAAGTVVHTDTAVGSATHCPYCALQCGMYVAKGEITPREDIPANAGGLCQKGWTAAELLTSPERLTTPLLHGSPVSWDEALDYVATRIGAIRAAHGPDAVAVFGGGGLTNEKAYQLGKFARVALRTSQIDYNGRFCMSSAAAAVNRAFGMDRGLPFPITDIARAGAVLFAGGNVAETMPPFVRHLTAMRSGGGRLVVVDPRLTQTAKMADLHLQVTPGTDLALALGLLHIAIAEGYADADYLAARTTGFEDVRTSVSAWWPERVERVTGVPVARMREAVRILGEAERAMVLTGRGAEQHAKGTDTVTAFVNLALTLGLPGREGSGYGCVTGQGNGQGGREHGQKADQLPGYRKIDDPAARAHVAAVWGIDPADLPGPGRSAYELLDALGTPEGPKALLLFGSNPVVSAPRAGHVTRRLDALDLLVVADFVLSETAAMADVVLPTTQWAEEAGTMTNLEGRVLLRRQAAAPPPGVRSDLEILRGLAERLGCAEKFPADPRTVFDELRRASAGGVADYSGITYERIAAETGVFWPCPETARDPHADPHADPHPGTPRPFLDRFATPDGRARLVPVDHRPPAEDVDEEFPLYLTSGRVLAHYQSGAQTRRIRPLTQASPEVFVELHPDLAERLGVAPGDRVRVRSRRGAAEGVARVSTSIRPDTLFMPFHWEGVNLLTNPALDPMSRMPEFKVCAAAIERCAEDGERVA